MQIPNRNSLDGLILATSRGPSEFTLRRNDTSIQYGIPGVADREVGVIAKIPRKAWQF